MIKSAIQLRSKAGCLAGCEDRSWKSDSSPSSLNSQPSSPNHSGRFMSEDPKLFEAGDYNLFRYVHNGPLDLTDPMGLDVVQQQPSGQSQAGPIPQIRLGGFGSISVTVPWNAGKIDALAKGATLLQTDLLKGVQLRQSYARMNEQKLSGLDPRFAPMARRFVDAANANVNPEGLEVRISHGTRSFAEQEQLYRKYLADRKYKAAAPGRCAHIYGMAIDIAVIRGSREVDRPAMWARLGRLGESLGLRWGHGFDDDDHFQHPGIPTSGRQLLRLHQEGRDVLTGEPLN
jgi:hypothetical protein